ncbi:Hypothetical protein PAU_00021 [Photorhabdus asymbiotica]|uniref:Uncharacterized protein n=1 Tax=Photorhabdus asymbiotica subsp. asymbiotica (strain ATCC 43949 / 3105-77) TaxID=553480 RepID=C7BTX9_PHOAA|nr:Hypothetical protein PAU_00021 [Photorhabdus asymbiotica]
MQDILEKLKIEFVFGSKYVCLELDKQMVEVTHCNCIVLQHSNENH